jgi:hypothetical protein
MKRLLIAGAAFALLVAVAAPAIAAGPPWAAPRGGPGFQAPAAGQSPGGGPGQGPAANIAAAIPAEVHAAIETAVRGAAARVLKITPEVLNQEMASGKTMAAIAASRNMPIATIQTAMTNARKFAVGQALAAGKITKEQADALLQAGPRFASLGRPGARPMMGPAYGQRPGMRGQPRSMRPGGGMLRYGPGR